MERLIDIEEFKKFRQTKIYKLIDLFWTDDQKSCIIENAFIFGFVVLSKIKYLRNELLDGDQIYVVKAGNYYFLMLKEKDTKALVLAGQTKTKIVAKKVGFYQQWSEMEFPQHIVDMIEKSKNIKEVKNALQKIMKMKAFW